MYITQWSVVLNYLVYNVQYSTVAYDMHPHEGLKQGDPPDPELNDKICRPQHYVQCLCN